MIRGNNETIKKGKPACKLGRVPSGNPLQRSQQRVVGSIEQVHHAILEGVAEAVVVVGGGVHVELVGVASVRGERRPLV